MNRDRLIENLGAVGKHPELWESKDCSAVVVLPYGGRVLGLFAPGDDENFLWTHAALTNIDTARQFYQSPLWHNSGGARTWLAPEVDFFFPEYPSLQTYFQQRALDPGDYSVEPVDGGLSWKTSSSLTLSRTKQQVRLSISKMLGPALNPLRYEAGSPGRELKFAGYTLRTSLQVEDRSAVPAIGIWQLIQMPHGGEMLIPTTQPSTPKIYMGQIEPEDLSVHDHLIRYRMRAQGEHKLGIRAVALLGRAGYIYGHGDNTSLVICNFGVNPSGEYVDVPWLEPVDFGYCFQACNVNSNLGAFSELEYHTPALDTRTGNASLEDESQLWAFRGPESTVRSVARQLLSAEA